MGSSIGNTVMNEFLPDKRGDIELLEPKEGEIWCINPDGSLEKSTFEPKRDSFYYVGYNGNTSRYLIDDYDASYTKTVTIKPSKTAAATTSDDYSVYRNVLYQVASKEGYSQHEVDLMLDFGYDTIEVEDSLYDKSFGTLLDEVKSYYAKLAQQEERQSEDESHITNLAKDVK
jgi:hypothetical protein